MSLISRRVGLQVHDRIRSGLTIAVAMVGALTVLGLILLWPKGEAPEIADQPNDYVDGTIVDATPNNDCTDIEAGGPSRCVTYDVLLSDGAQKGEEVSFSVRPTQTEIPDLDVGDKIVLRHFPDSPAEFRYGFSDFQRSTPLVWLLVGFVAVVLVFGRVQGLRALAGLGLSLLVLVMFVVPALLRDSPAIPVALVATAAVAFLAIYLAHGVNISSTIALAGSLVSLAVTCGLAIVAAAATQLSGLANEDAQTLRVTADALDLRGLLLAGIVIGALGVLDDVTVSQVSTVAALRRANMRLGPRALYSEATKVGRDHVASAVNTLVLAYAGASLPLLLFYAQGSQPLGRMLTGEPVAVEIVRMLVGSIGLVLSVPVTTALAAVVLHRTKTERLPADDGHGHDHGQRYRPKVTAPTAPGTWAQWPGPEPPAPGGTTEPWF